jgi:hypothetical protein
MSASPSPRPRVFLLSPADCSGKRALLLHRPEADHDLARRLRGKRAALGEVFSFVSSLYFRGKLAYARAFAQPPRGVAGALVITPCDGLSTPESLVDLEDLRRYAGVPVDSGDERYRQPLLRDLRALLPRLEGADVVLLGSIASRKYTDLLTDAFGARVLFPTDFVGRGDMSRGGLMLRCVNERRELGYVPLLGAERHGSRPARLAPVPRRPVPGAVEPEAPRKRAPRRLA